MTRPDRQRPTDPERPAPPAPDDRHERANDVADLPIARGSAVDTTDAANHPAAPSQPQAADDTLSASFAPSEMVLAGTLDVVPGDPPVPISVWRAATPLPHSPPSNGGSSTSSGSRTGWSTRAPSDGSLTPRLAGLLVATYTGLGDTIVDLSTDPALAGAAGAGARHYLPVTDVTELAGLDHVAGSVALIVMRWPAPELHPAGPADGDRGVVDTAAAALTMSDLFTTCRHLLAADGCTIVVLTPTAPDAPYVEHANVIIPAAARAGLGYLQHIVAVTTHLDRHDSPAQPEGPHPPLRRHQDQARDNPGNGRPDEREAPGDVLGMRHVDLLVFVLAGGRLA
jgi:hypothetical protein